jgi:hypothetical protein
MIDGADWSQLSRVVDSWTGYDYDCSSSADNDLGRNDDDSDIRLYCHRGSIHHRDTTSVVDAVMIVVVVVRGVVVDKVQDSEDHDAGAYRIVRRDAVANGGEEDHRDAVVDNNYCGRHHPDNAVELGKHHQNRHHHHHSYCDFHGGDDAVVVVLAVVLSIVRRHREEDHN